MQNDVDVQQLTMTDVLASGVALESWLCDESADMSHVVPLELFQEENMDGCSTESELTTLNCPEFLQQISFTYREKATGHVGRYILLWIVGTVRVHHNYALSKVLLMKKHLNLPIRAITCREISSNGMKELQLRLSKSFDIRLKYIPFKVEALQQTMTEAHVVVVDETYRIDISNALQTICPQLNCAIESVDSNMIQPCHSVPISADLQETLSVLSYPVSKDERWSEATGERKAIRDLLAFCRNETSRTIIQEEVKNGGCFTLLAHLRAGYLSPRLIQRCLEDQKHFSEQSVLHWDDESSTQPSKVWKARAINVLLKQREQYISAAFRGQFEKPPSGNHFLLSEGGIHISTKLMEDLEKTVSPLRTVQYFPSQLEAAETMDSTWNFIQNHFKQVGYLHPVWGPYWTWKVLEWTPTLSIGFTLISSLLLKGSVGNSIEIVPMSLIPSLCSSLYPNPPKPALINPKGESRVGV